MGSYKNNGIFTNLGRRETGCLRPLEIFDAVRGSGVFVKKLAKWRVLTGHNGCVNTIVWNDRGNLILSGSDDCQLNVYDVDRNAMLHSIRSGHRANIFSAKFLPLSSDEKVVSCCGSGTIHYNEIGMESLYGHNYFNCHAGTTYEVAIIQGDPNLFLTCGEDGTVRLFDLRVKSHCYCEECRKDVLVECGHAVTSLFVNPIMPYHLAIGCEDSTVRVYDMRCLSAAKERGYFLRRRRQCPGLLCSFKPPNLKRETCRVTSLRYSNDGKELLASYCTDYVYLFSMDEATRLVEAKKLEHRIGPDGTRGAEDPQQSSGLPSMKRLRLRGDWSDTGPHARPESDEEGRESSSDVNLAIMQRIYGVFTRSMQEAFGTGSETDEDDVEDDIRSEAEGQAQQDEMEEEGAVNETPIEANLRADNGSRDSVAGQNEIETRGEIVSEVGSENIGACGSDLHSGDDGDIKMEARMDRQVREPDQLSRFHANSDFATKLAGEITTASIRTVSTGPMSHRQASESFNADEHGTISADLSSVANENEPLDDDSFEFARRFTNTDDQCREEEREKNELATRNNRLKSTQCCECSTDNYVNVCNCNDTKNLLMENEILRDSSSAYAKGGDLHGNETTKMTCARSSICCAGQPRLDANAVGLESTCKKCNLDDECRVTPEETVMDVEESRIEVEEARLNIQLETELQNESDGARIEPEEPCIEIRDTRIESEASRTEQHQMETGEVHRDVEQRSTREDASSRMTRGSDRAESSSARNSAAAKIQRYFRSRNSNAEDVVNEGDVSLVLEPRIHFKGHRNARTMIKEANFWGNDFVLSGSDCGRIFVWDKQTGEIVTLLDGDKHVVNCVQPHPFDPILATSGIDHDVKVWAPILPEPAVLNNVNEILRRNEKMLDESRFTITVPASFMLRMLTSISRVRRFRRSQQEENNVQEEEIEDGEDD
eukprot:gene199-813_t